MHHDDYKFDHETIYEIASTIDIEKRLDIASENSNEGQFPYFILEGLPFVIALYTWMNILENIKTLPSDKDAIDQFCEDEDVHPEDVILVREFLNT